jgi:hypothetical protein
MKMRQMKYTEDRISIQILQNMIERNNFRFKEVNSPADITS